MSHQNSLSARATPAHKFSSFQLTATTVTDLTKVYDFGNKPGLNCSYAYHFPFARAGNGTNAITGFPISVSSAPGSPLAGDKNPGLDKNASTYIKGGDNGGTVITSASPN